MTGLIIVYIAVVYQLTAGVKTVTIGLVKVGEEFTKGLGLFFDFCFNFLFLTNHIGFFKGFDIVR